jgi:hydrogenase maturation protease
MIDEEQVKQYLEAVPVPGVGRSIVGLNMVQGINIVNGSVSITLASTGLDEGAMKLIRHQTREILNKFPAIQDVDVEYTSVKANELNQIGHMIAIMSGKGGVGKSLVSGLLSIALKRKGYEVGILDADVTGPSIPRMFGTMTRPQGNEDGILPVLTRSGIEIMSVNLLLPNEDDAVIWRGPIIGNTIKQFGEDVLWGNLDYLLVDLPPGTADAPLTLMQSFPISGVVIVFTPQDLVEMIVKKAVNMAHQMDKRVMGVVENMSYLHVEEIDKNIDIFGKSRAEEIARNLNAPLLGKLPIDPEIAKLCDKGDIEKYKGDIIPKLGEAFLKQV